MLAAWPIAACRPTQSASYMVKSGPQPGRPLRVGLAHRTRTSRASKNHNRRTYDHGERGLRRSSPRVATHVKTRSWRDCTPMARGRAVTGGMRAERRMRTSLCRARGVLKCGGSAKGACADWGRASRHHPGVESAAAVPPISTHAHSPPRVPRRTHTLSSIPRCSRCFSILPCLLLPVAMSDPGSTTPPADATKLSSPPSGSLAFLVHSPDTVRSNLPPDVDNKPLARQKRRRTRSAFAPLCFPLLLRRETRLYRPRQGVKPDSFMCRRNHANPPLRAIARKTRKY